MARDYPTFSISDTTVVEGNAGVRPASFVVSLSAPSTEVLAVQYETIELPGSPWPDDYENQSATAGSDFIHTSGLLTFNPGEIQKTLTVSVLGDEVHEYNEGFLVRLIQASPAAVDKSETRAVILNDDILEITISSVTVIEGDSGTETANFVISLSRETDQYLVGSWFTANSSAGSDSEHRGAGGSIQYSSAPGQTNITLPLSIYGDKNIEDDETLFLNLSVLWGTDVQVGDPGKCTIVNDDFFLKTESSNAEEIILRLEGALGATHVIEFSTNLTDWTSVSTNKLHPDRIQYFAAEKAKLGFYRATLLQ